jgi:hypothetical protein
MSYSHAEAQVVVPVVRRIPVAVRRPAVTGVVVPATTAIHAVRAFSHLPLGIVTRPCGISNCVPLLRT